jgi:hypothetical protein
VVRELQARPVSRARTILPQRPMIRVSGFLLLVALSAVASSPGAWAGPTERVASKHLGAARKMADQSVDLITDFGPLAAEIWNSDCRLTHPILRAQATSVRRFVLLYSKEFCEPWADFWHQGLSPCGTRFSPAWCVFDSDIAARLDLVGYLAAMRSGMEGARGAERANILMLVVRTLNAQPVFEAYPLALLEVWAGKLTATYLRNTTPEDAVALADGFRSCWFRTSSPIRRAFGDYADVNPAISDMQKAAIERDLAESPDPREANRN